MKRYTVQAVARTLLAMLFRSSSNAISTTPEIDSIPLPPGLAELSYDDLERVEFEYVEAQAKAIGKTNRMWNPYQALLERAEYFRQQGLEPVILSSVDGRYVTITSEENIQRKLN